MPTAILQGVDDDQLLDWFNVARRSMLGDRVEAEAFEERRGVYDLHRCTAATGEDGRLCGSAYAFGTELTVPGGMVPAAGVTAVGVLPTHRRQGHLGRMMETQMADIAEREEAVAVLIAAEYPIYSRFGYGHATDACGVVIDAAALAGRPDASWVAPASGTTELVDNDTLYKVLPDIYNRARKRQPGHIAWNDYTYRVVTGMVAPLSGPDGTGGPKVLWRDDAGEIQGAAIYQPEQGWENNRPLGHLTCRLLVAVTDEAERELVRYLTSVDWIATVRLDVRPVDEVVPLWLRDGRVATLVDRSDHLWARIVHLPAALEARTYAAPGRLVVQIVDPMGYAEGRFLLDVDGAGGTVPGAGHPASCTPTTAEPDLVTSVSTLSSAYFGGLSWARLAVAGQVEERRRGAVAMASTMFGTARAPWCAMAF